MILVKKVDRETWDEKFAANAHLAVFDQKLSDNKDNIDFALLAVDSESDHLVSYVTIREYDKDYAHWFWGGSFPNYRGSITAYKSMEAILDFMKENYKKMSFFTQNNNFPMIKFGLKHGFQIVGMRMAKDGLLLEHVVEFNKGEK